ncbi:MAG: hypothetical protein IPM24_28490 [Bryobacterales bacterium]|nr:hypothetical protein [Bryobacterales bacterium]
MGGLRLPPGSSAADGPDGGAVPLLAATFAAAGPEVNEAGPPDLSGGCLVRTGGFLIT